MEPITAVVLSHNRRGPLLHTVDRLRALPERPEVIVVDNGSHDGSAAAVREHFPDVRLIEAGANLGAAGRNLGVEAAQTELVAFCDDDSWYAAGALARAARLFDARPEVGLIAARILVGAQEELDPTSAEMAGSPLSATSGLPRVMGFVACGAVVRRRSFLDVGGFHSDYAIGGEEALLALDMAAAGWELVYADDVVAHHHPPQRGPKRGRRRRATRNDLWSAWLRRPMRGALEATARLAWSARRDDEARAGVVDAVRGAPRVIRERRPVPDRVERDVRELERSD